MPASPPPIASRTCARSSTAPQGRACAPPTLQTARGERPLTVGPGGTFVAVVRGYPEDSAVGVTLRFADGHNERHNFGASPDTLLDPDGGQAWTIERFTFDGRFRCANVRTARLGAETGPRSSPSACLALRTSDRAWVADARRFRRGDRGASWLRPLGVARTSRAHGRLGRRPRRQDAALGHAAWRRRSPPADADARGRLRGRAAGVRRTRASSRSMSASPTAAHSAAAPARVSPPIPPRRPR